LTPPNQTQRPGYTGQIKPTAFTIVELLVVITIVAILAGLLLTATSKSKAESQRAVCLSNQRQLVAALMMYADSDSRHSFGGTKDKRKFYPLVDENWLQTNAGLPLKIFFCPATRNGPGRLMNNSWYIGLAIPAGDALDKSGYSYDPLLWFADWEDFWNGNRYANKNSRFVEKTESSIQSYAHANEAFGMNGQRFGPSRIWLLTDNDDRGENKFWPEGNGNHGAAGANIAFADGHVEWVPRTMKFVYMYEASQDNNRTRATPRPGL
jgi:prepilin-type processing-associated H-X9-DG protein